MSLEQPSLEVPARSGFPFRPIAFVTLGLVVGVGAMALLRPGAKDGHDHGATSAAAPKKQMYQCPMHPQIIQDHPGACPICGMDLVPMEEVGTGGTGLEGHAAITIDPERQQLIGLRTEKVAEGMVSGELRALGRVVVDETRVRKVTVKVEGFVEKLFVDFVGKPVAKGQPLFSLYSPEFVSAQREYLLALQTQKSLAGGSLQGSGGELLESAKRRLGLWDVPKEAIDHLEKTGEVQKALTLRSPISGVVTVKNVMEGARITPADILFEITDLSRVWVQVDVYEAELGRAKVGMPADLMVEASPGKTFRGRIVFVDPVMDPKTRTARARVEFANPRGELKPEMFGDVLLKGQGRKGMIIPLDAVLDAGTTKVVFVALGGGRFEPREVTTGTMVGEKVEIRSGLKVGEEVVVRANFLVDSESRLKAALAQLTHKH
ncbi:MAG: efflux RND transporter periplasmic adaptor subunit [Geothrix sp.]|uniref:efflux RND transporter periplasmic adaptor subunit n=1 Tax=Geothrix sp. TaxID=1962974 RepID=UPI00182EE0F6|nr:efflux RND transporter periplasmic adaptor subunit [Geothrix sp.]NWJ42235.1 efflux RND transporter periplasmic adaptor subunit [Geothrix sp.]WIL19798.1 MAG: efflux RND transporter periplasmic adaptor subunit [Geothrix sp.]